MKGKVNEKFIVVLAAGVKKKNGQWASTDFSAAEDFLGAPGGKIRVLAVSIVHKKDPESLIIASGGKGRDRNVLNIKHPPLSKILKRELVEAGIPSKKIIEENESDTTYQQLLNLQSIITKKKIKYLTIVSNEYHLPRIKAMIECGPKLGIAKKMLGKSEILLKSAEDIVMDYDPKSWRKNIKKIYRGKNMADLIFSEKRGVRQIKNKIYKF